MSEKLAPSIFSRLLLVVAGLLVIVFTYWFIATWLAPVSAPPAPGSRGTVTFDPKLDVSKSETFFRLRPLGPLEPSIVPSGRPNPFVPPIPASLATSTTSTPPVPVPAAATTSESVPTSTTL